MLIFEMQIPTYFEHCKLQFPANLLMQLAYQPYIKTLIDTDTLKHTLFIMQQSWKSLKEKPKLNFSDPPVNAPIETVRLHASSVIYLVTFETDVLKHVDRTWSGKLDMWCCKTHYQDSRIRDIIIQGFLNFLIQ